MDYINHAGFHRFLNSEKDQRRLSECNRRTKLRMSEEEQEEEVIDRRNTEEISLVFLFPPPILPFLSSCHPPTFVMSFPVRSPFLCMMGWSIDKGKDWQSDQSPSPVTWARPPAASFPGSEAYVGRHRFASAAVWTGSDVTAVPSPIKWVRNSKQRW